MYLVIKLNVLIQQSLNIKMLENSISIKPAMKKRNLLKKLLLLISIYKISNTIPWKLKHQNFSNKFIIQEESQLLKEILLIVCMFLFWFMDFKQQEKICSYLE